MFLTCQLHAFSCERFRPRVLASFFKRATDVCQGAEKKREVARVPGQLEGVLEER